MLSTWQQKNMYIFFSFFSLKYISGKCPLYSNVFEFCGKFWVIFTWDVSKPLLLFTRTNNSQFWREWNSIDKLQSNRFFWKKICYSRSKTPLLWQNQSSQFFFSLCLYRYLYTAGSNHRRSSVKKVFLKFPQNSQEGTCATVSLLIKLQAFSL